MVPELNAGKGSVAGGVEPQQPQVMRMKLVGGNAKERVVGLEELPGRSNYFIGNDPKKWRTNVPSYAQVKYEDIYPGVDLVYYGNQRQLEYDFVVAPGADPNQVKLSFAGADGMRVDMASGDLVLKVGDDEVRFRNPAVYQPAVAVVYDRHIGGAKTRSTFGKANSEPRVPIPDSLSGTFVLASDNQVAFHVAGYDPKRVLVIDPVLSYSTYLGGSMQDSGSSIAVDSSGNAYVTGVTKSVDFPTVNPFQATNEAASANPDNPTAFVAKLNSTGSALVYSTYLGGSFRDEGNGIAVDSFGNAYVTGLTASTDFPTVNPFQATNNASSETGSESAFVAKISPTPVVTLSTNSLSFASQNVSTTSAEQSVTLTNTGDGLLSITSIAATGDFAETNTCGSSVAAGANCAISVTFTPVANGSLTGTLSINDDAAGSPQTVALKGTGQDFTLAAPSSSSTSATVAPGQSATYTLSVAGQGGFNQSVSFTCTGAPSEATCTVSPSPVTPGSSATNTTVSVTTTAPSVSAPRSRPISPVPPLSPGLRGLLMLALALATVVWAFGCRNQPGVSQWQSAIVPLASGLLLTLALAGCGGGGGGGGGGPTPNTGTPAGNYTLTVTGTAGSGSSALSHSMTLTLNVS